MAFSHLHRWCQCCHCHLLPLNQCHWWFENIWNINFWVGQLVVYLTSFTNQFFNDRKWLHFAGEVRHQRGLLLSDPMYSSAEPNLDCKCLYSLPPRVLRTFLSLNDSDGRRFQLVPTLYAEPSWLPAMCGKHRIAHRDSIPSKPSPASNCGNVPNWVRQNLKSNFVNKLTVQL